MALIRSKHTKPERAARRIAFALGYRYRLHGKGLPGRPDMVFASRRKAIFVHGCFWHRHEGCGLARLPKSKLVFWREKLEGNRRRDRRNRAALARLGWRTMVLWECELSNEARVRARVKGFLGRRGSAS